MFNDNHNILRAGLPVITDATFDLKTVSHMSFLQVTYTMSCQNFMATIICVYCMTVVTIIV